MAYTHGGTTWHLPADLIALQRAWDAADAACARLADSGDKDAYQAARRHRLDLTDELYGHPWLLAQMAGGNRYRADLALKAYVRGGE